MNPLDLIDARLIDLVLAGLLTAVLIYGMVLSRRLAAFKASRGEMEALVAQLSGTVVQAKTSIGALSEAGDEAEERLSMRLKQVRRLIDEMEAMHASGEALANRLETAAHAPRAGLTERPKMSGQAPVRAAAEAAAAPRAEPWPQATAGERAGRLTGPLTWAAHRAAEGEQPVRGAAPARCPPRCAGARTRCRGP